MTRAQSLLPTEPYIPDGPYPPDQLVIHFMSFQYQVYRAMGWTGRSGPLDPLRAALCEAAWEVGVMPQWALERNTRGCVRIDAARLRERRILWRAMRLRGMSDVEIGAACCYDAKCVGPGIEALVAQERQDLAESDRAKRRRDEPMTARRQWQADRWIEQMEDRWIAKFGKSADCA
jgi:hypothetical protein